MSTDKNYFLGVGQSLALHYSNAANAVEGVKLEPITVDSFKDTPTCVVRFANAAEAKVYKDKLCIKTAYALNRETSVKNKIILNQALEDFCTMEDESIDRRLEMA